MTPRRFAEVVAHPLTVSNLTHRDLASTCGLSTVTIWQALVNCDMSALVRIGRHTGYVVDGSAPET